MFPTKLRQNLLNIPKADFFGMRKLLPVLVPHVMNALASFGALADRSRILDLFCSSAVVGCGKKGLLKGFFTINFGDGEDEHIVIISVPGI